MSDLDRAMEALFALDIKKIDETVTLVYEIVGNNQNPGCDGSMSVQQVVGRE